MNHLYHLECQTTPDGDIVIRMVEYDFHIGLGNISTNNGRRELKFPQSAILQLRSNKNTSDEEVLDIVFADGERYTYKVPVIKIKDYSREEIFEKELYVLLPFYIFKYEKELAKIEESEEKLSLLKEEFESIKSELEGLKLAGKISTSDARNIIVLSKKVIDNIAIKYEKIKEGVGTVMGGKLIDADAYIG